MPSRGNKRCEGSLEETGARKVEFSVWRNRELVQHSAPRLHPALSERSGKGRKLRPRTRQEAVGVKPGAEAARACGFFFFFFLALCPSPLRTEPGKQ